jgi:glycosyltransferase involved in cell wall biosynthesis
MKIIHTVLGKANPERMNGVNRVAYQLAKTQWQMGHDVTVWGIANSLEHNYPPRPFRTELFLQSPHRFRLPPALANAVDALEKDAVVHLHGAFIPVFFPLANRLRKRGIGYIITPHGAFSKVAMLKGKWRKRLYFFLLEKKLLKHAKAVQLLGEQEFSHLAKLADIPHKVLIPNGIDLSELPIVPPIAHCGQLVFGFCGRLDTYYKGLDIMLHGFALFLKKGHQARLELIGDGEDRAALEQLAEQLGIRQCLTFYGARYGEEKYRLMVQCDVFLHTSRSEGFPMAVLEAAALGLPCLTSDGTNINRYIAGYGAGIPMTGKLDAGAVCAAMEAAAILHGEKKLKPLGDNAKRMVQEAFDWRIISEALLEAYRL